MNGCDVKKASLAPCFKRTDAPSSQHRGTYCCTRLLRKNAVSTGLLPPRQRLKKLPRYATCCPITTNNAIAYTNRTAYLLDPQRTYRAKIELNRPVTMNGYVVGTWKRTIKTKMVNVEIELFTPLQPAETRALQYVVERSARHAILYLDRIPWLEIESCRAIWLRCTKGKHSVGYDLVDHVWWRPCARRTVIGCQ
jgi:hypothetical protein